MAKMSKLLLCFTLQYFFVIACSANPAFKSISTDESALLSIKSHVTNDPFSILATNWTKGTSVCDWVGISCNWKRQRVAALDLSGGHFQGTIAKEVGNLSFLVSLDVSGNNFYGFIPDQIGNLRRLRYLYMQDNTLSGLIPKSLEYLTRMELILNNNSLSGPIPRSIFNISSLRAIGFMNNSLNGTLPDDLCTNLPKLEYFNASVNHIGGEIPATLSQCSEIKVLRFGTNNFKGSIPASIGNLSKTGVVASWYQQFDRCTAFIALQHIIIEGTSSSV
ncbi:OLC1v1023771C1 [Oldenlandia corymbosa var. corymbosa]|uniref:OLC1v1023771C1 n=1 Tax=Oldenlandia corymbosa var. corymbosa TaxID=529605 RepID=A0AAV1C365_OLDCO|nr:OLC1v1023771C1 [Oldenlandia corymbosa var. corymbosa]